MAPFHRGRRAPPGLRDQLRDAIALRKLGGGSAPVPLVYAVRQVAQSWGVPPWEVTGEEPTREVRSRWTTRELIFLRMEG